MAGRRLVGWQAFESRERSSASVIVRSILPTTIMSRAGWAPVSASGAWCASRSRHRARAPADRLMRRGSAPSRSTARPTFAPRRVLDRQPPRSRFSPAVSDTMAASRRASRLSNDDLPALGGPMMAGTNPAQALAAPVVEMAGDGSRAPDAVGNVVSQAGRQILVRKIDRRLEMGERPGPVRGTGDAGAIHLLAARRFGGDQSAIAPAWVRSSRPCSNARRVNSPPRRRPPRRWNAASRRPRARRAGAARPWSRRSRCSAPRTSRPRSITSAVVGCSTSWRGGGSRLAAPPASARGRRSRGAGAE